MAELPAQEFRWATETVQETTEINGINILVTNKIEPAEAYKNTGILARERVSRSRINWAFWLLGEYVNHLVGKDAVDTIHYQANNESDVDVSERLGGTWAQIGTTSQASTTIYIYRKTAL